MLIELGKLYHSLFVLFLAVLVEVLLSSWLALALWVFLLVWL